MASARDIIAAADPPRAVLVDYPLGHTTGRPFAPDEQTAVTRAGLEGLETITTPGTIVDLDNRWADDEAWKAAAADASIGDVRAPRDTVPRYQLEEDRLAAEGAQGAIA
jgi:hypothetical protein